MPAAARRMPYTVSPNGTGGREQIDECRAGALIPEHAVRFVSHWRDALCVSDRSATLMYTTSYAGLAAISLFYGGMIYAAFAELTPLRIPNGIIALLCLAFLLAALLAGWGTQAIGLALAVGLSVLLCMAR